MKVAIACDHRGYTVKQKIAAQVADRGHEVLDFGTDSPKACDYPDFAIPASVVSTFGVMWALDFTLNSVTMLAPTHGEVARLSWEAYEALAARDPRVGRMVLADAGRLMAARVRAAGIALPGWTG